MAKTDKRNNLKKKKKKKDRIPLKDQIKWNLKTSKYGKPVAKYL